jgi:hypothetical protein
MGWGVHVEGREPREARDGAREHRHHVRRERERLEAVQLEQCPNLPGGGGALEDEASSSFVFVHTPNPYRKRPAGHGQGGQLGELASCLEPLAKARWSLAEPAPCSPRARATRGCAAGTAHPPAGDRASKVEASCSLVFVDAPSPYRIRRREGTG